MRMTRHRRRGAHRYLNRACAVGFSMALGVVVPPAAGDMAEAVALQTENVKAEVAAQQQIDALQERTRDLAATHRQVERELAQVRAYREHLTTMVAAQRAQLDGLQSQLEQADGIETAVLPLLAEMVDTLAQFIELDLPFLLAERRQRAAELRDLVDDPEVPTGEKYRRIMAAYQEEAKYGTTLQTYRDVLSVDGRELNLELLRVGRIALIYRTPDGRDYGAWEQSGRRWIALPHDHAGSLRTAFRVADKQIAPELLAIPLPAPEAVP
jgi:hypothetical protein